MEPIGETPDDAYRYVLNYGYLCGKDDRKLASDTAACVRLVRWLLETATGSHVVALHFHGEVLAGTTIEQARLWESTLMLPDNLKRASLKIGGDSVVLVYHPTADDMAEASPELVSLAEEIAGIVKDKGMTLLDFILDGTPGATGEYVSVLHPHGQTPTPFDGGTP